MRKLYNKKNKSIGIAKRDNKVEVITTYKGHLEKFERRDKHSSKIRNDLIHQFDALRVDNEKALTDITATKERGIELIDEK